ncbi:hypothetical protein A3C87_00890 [Candidatus Kaiserbacteria bacterium RIFCSPHIGHO2_02_FULL_49_34]|uniref:Methyltransferase domain-containing protein n=1 Tax=Candidatus Kaiserbacteria bacterium RIFCSPHIGHO2_02_FULL_49_34 TaxID=1798491 RepID=A0A1F6DKJ4_9BACT|nr:MAG: hypothetical protein A3C87_00890 [Candidatus Kaiserbacteria bacterium RIFCSPHIGHO2_02_FULL_49_34]
MAKKVRHGATFWDHEYTHAEHLKLSDEVSEDLEKFLRFLARHKNTMVRQHPHVLDLGCGNGRNLIHLAKNIQARGYGYDTSAAAIKQARLASEGLPLTYEVRSIAGVLDLPDNSQDIVIDMMASHFLSNAEREFLRNEIMRVLRPGGWYFIKTFLRDEDIHTSRLLKEAGTEEEGTYIHPIIGVPEHVYFEHELVEFMQDGEFVVESVHKSHRHRTTQGKAGKRRTISIYARKDPYAK